MFITYTSFKKNKYKYLLLTYFLLLHFIITILLFKTDFVSKFKARLGFNVESSEFNPFYQNMVAFHARQDKNVPTGSILFFGDSIAQGLAVTAVDKYAVNFGIGHDSSLSLLKRLPLYSSVQRAGLIVLTIGINDVLRNRPDSEIIDNYKKIIAFIPPHIPVVITPIFPIDELALKKPEYNKRIDLLNDSIKKLCELSKEINCLETWQTLRDSDNNLADIYHTGDGLHLSPQGNKVWIERLKFKIAKIYK